MEEPLFGDPVGSEDDQFFTDQAAQDDSINTDGLADHTRASLRTTLDGLTPQNTFCDGSKRIKQPNQGLLVRVTIQAHTRNDMEP